VTDLEKAHEALAAGRRDEALVHAWKAARCAQSGDLPQLECLAAELGDAALVSTVLVRRVRTRSSDWCKWENRVTTALALTIGYVVWLGVALLITLTHMSNRLGAVAISIVAAAAIVVAGWKGWIEFEGADGD
jgi:hypothetical protein